MYKSEKGITFMVLVITVLVLIIIGSATAGAAISTYKKAKIKVYTEEMELIKEKLTLYEDKASINSELASLRNIGEPIPNSKTAFENKTDQEKEDLRNAKELLDKLDRENKLENVVIVNHSGEEDSKYVNYRYLRRADLPGCLELNEDLKTEGDFIIDIVGKKVYSVKPVKYEGRDCYSVDDIRGK